MFQTLDFTTLFTPECMPPSRWEERRTARKAGRAVALTDDERVHIEVCPTCRRILRQEEEDHPPEAHTDAAAFEDDVVRALWLLNRFGRFPDIRPFRAWSDTVMAELCWQVDDTTPPRDELCVVAELVRDLPTGPAAQDSDAVPTVMVNSTVIPPRIPTEVAPTVARPPAGPLGPIEQMYLETSRSRIVRAAAAHRMPDAARLAEFSRTLSEKDDRRGDLFLLAVYADRTLQELTVLFPDVRALEKVLWATFNAACEALGTQNGLDADAGRAASPFGEQVIGGSR